MPQHAGICKCPPWGSAFPGELCLWERPGRERKDGFLEESRCHEYCLLFCLQVAFWQAVIFIRWYLLLPDKRISG